MSSTARDRHGILTAFRADHPALIDFMPPVVAAAKLLVKNHKRGGWVFTCGNGGSAADAAHLVGEFVKGFALLRHPAKKELAALAKISPELAEHGAKLQGGIRAVALDAGGALGSAIANDQGAELVFAQQVWALAGRGDVVIGFSTSGNSRNVVRALQTARARGAHTIGFTGAKPAMMHEFSDIAIKAPQTETHRVQECHLPLYHLLCLLVEEAIFGS
jgi:phosphoheptose isomerase